MLRKLGEDVTLWCSGTSLGEAAKMVGGGRVSRDVHGNKCARRGMGWQGPGRAEG